MKRIGKIISLTLMSVCTLTASAVRVHCADDTLFVAKVLESVAEPGASPATKVLPVAKMFLGLPYGETTQSDSIGTAVIYTHAFDKTDFLTSVVALAYTATRPMPRWRDYASDLVEIGRRRGKDGGLDSKLIYGADWVTDNIYRGNIKELTELGPSPLFKTKSLDYVSRHRDLYAALKDSDVYEAQKFVEMGYRNYKIPHLKKESLMKKEVLDEMKDGDIVMFLSNDIDRDVYQQGIVVLEDDGPHFIYASDVEGKIVESVEPLARYVKRETKRIYGYRWLRLAE